jgi:hypothetical protein
MVQAALTSASFVLTMVASASEMPEMKLGAHSNALATTAICREVLGVPAAYPPQKMK